MFGIIRSAASAAVGGVKIVAVLLAPGWLLLGYAAYRQHLENEVNHGR